MTKDADEGTKELALRDFIRWIAKRCPNIKFTLTDKDVIEINGFRSEVPDAKHQLCYWHGLKYVEKRLGENKPPAAYDPRIAHHTFDFIDPTWAPGVTMSWLEDGVHPTDAEVPDPPETLKIKVNFVNMTIESTSIPNDTHSSTLFTQHCRSPIFVWKDGDTKTPKYAAPPPLKDIRSDLPEFARKNIAPHSWRCGVYIYISIHAFH